MRLLKCSNRDLWDHSSSEIQFPLRDRQINGGVIDYWDKIGDV